VVFYKSLSQHYHNFGQYWDLSYTSIASTPSFSGCYFTEQYFWVGGLVEVLKTLIISLII